MAEQTQDQMADQKSAAAAWFADLRDRICARFEGIEDALTTGPFAHMTPGRFTRKETRREAATGDGGGGVMSVMKGRVFEKVGVNVSEVHGTLGAAAQQAMSARPGMGGLTEDPRFWASGVSLVAHMRNPRVPAVHMNTRMFWTPHGWWFGGGSDLNPAIEFDQDTEFFHAAQKRACDAHDAGYYPKFKAWADDYFMVRHRGRPRGVGGIFYDDLNTGDWDADFAFTKDVGAAFLDAFPHLVEQRMHEPWTEAEKEAQLIHRGLYAEFNLVWDRGTKFGLETGHNVEAVLMSLPPEAKWP